MPRLTGSGPRLPLAQLLPHHVVEVGGREIVRDEIAGRRLRLRLVHASLQQLRQRVTASYHLGPMDRAETQEYVEHRLRHVGWSNFPRFEPGAFDAIYTFSAGIPRRINTLCNRLMLAAMLSEQRHCEHETNCKICTAKFCTAPCLSTGPAGIRRRASRASNPTIHTR